ncbi:MAG: DUF2272 domain-containing protein [Cyanobacteria bacterium K_Offshore_surface_m2_239]|nr:DUF2272 domain-containing protein [Cyanobacteria bacterium K_Offshore_surface_m2_239]
MAQPEGEEDQYLATLHELEATQEDIANYQSLLKDLPEIYERKFNERLKPLLDRQQHLLDERETLLQQLPQGLPASEAVVTDHHLGPAPEAPPPPGVAAPPRRPEANRLWWLAGLAALGLTLGLQLHKQTVPDAATASRSLESAPSTVESAPRPTDAPTTKRGNVVKHAIEEWKYFDQPTLRNGVVVRFGRKEGDQGQWQRVITYWKEGLQNASVNQRSEVQSVDHPWSAAFIAYVMKQAGVDDGFLYAASHSGSIKEAIHNRQNSINNASLIGHRVSDYAPRPGDLLCANRSWAIGQVTYDNAGAYDFFPSRCELVIRTSVNQIEAIGGDLMEAVTRNIIPARNGKIAPEAAPTWFVVIQTRID